MAAAPKHTSIFPRVLFFITYRCLGSGLSIPSFIQAYPVIHLVMQNLQQHQKTSFQGILRENLSVWDNYSSRGGDKSGNSFSSPTSVQFKSLLTFTGWACIWACRVVQLFYKYSKLYKNTLYVNIVQPGLGSFCMMLRNEYSNTFPQGKWCSSSVLGLPCRCGVWFEWGTRFTKGFCHVTWGSNPISRVRWPRFVAWKPAGECQTARESALCGCRAELPQQDARGKEVPREIGMDLQHRHNQGGEKWPQTGE